MIDRFLDSLLSCAGSFWGSRVLLAVSGGPDSMAMLHLFLMVKDRLGLSLEVVHLHHGIRGAEADQDAGFVKEKCRELNVPFRLFRFDVNRFATQKKVSLEAAGHRIRRHFFLRYARIGRVDWVAFAHTADDQAETVFMNFVRGSGPRGLSGILRRQGIIIHPLLPFAKKEILTFLHDHGVQYRLDSSNADSRHLRNKVRHEIFPYLEEKTKFSFKGSFLRMARIFQEEEKWLEDQVTPIFAERFSRLGFGAVELRICRGELPPALERRILRMFFEKVAGSLEVIDFSSIEEMRILLGKGAGKRFEISKFVVEKTRNGLALSRCLKKWNGQVPLSVPGEAYLKELGLSVKATVFDKEKGSHKIEGEALIDYDCVRFPTFLRTRREGDFFSPPGMKGRKKLQDYFVDLRVPRILRDRIPLLVSSSEIVWVGGYGTDRHSVATSRTKNLLRLSLHE